MASARIRSMIGLRIGYQVASDDALSLNTANADFQIRSRTRNITMPETARLTGSWEIPVIHRRKPCAPAKPAKPVAARPAATMIDFAQSAFLRFALLMPPPEESAAPSIASATTPK